MIFYYPYESFFENGFLCVACSVHQNKWMWGTNFVKLVVSILRNSEPNLDDFLEKNSSTPPMIIYEQ